MDIGLFLVSCGFVNNAACVYGLCGHVLSFLLGGYRGMELLVHMETLCVTFQELSEPLHHFTFFPGVQEGWFLWVTMRIMVVPPANWGFGEFMSCLKLQ